MKALGPDKIKYLEPGQPPIELVEDQVRAFVLGPPRNKQQLNLADPSKKETDQVYAAPYMGALEQIEPALDREPDRPFDTRFALPITGTEAIAFFQQRYWADANAPEILCAAIVGPPKKEHTRKHQWRTHQGHVEGERLG